MLDIRHIFYYALSPSILLCLLTIPLSYPMLYHFYHFYISLITLIYPSLPLSAPHHPLYLPPSPTTHHIRHVSTRHQKVSLELHHNRLALIKYAACSTSTNFRQCFNIFFSLEAQIADTGTSLSQLSYFNEHL